MSDLCQTSCGCREEHNRTVNEIYSHLAMAGTPLAMAYVPDQQWGPTYPLCTGLKHGTIFSELHKPFCGKGGKRW